MTFHTKLQWVFGMIKLMDLLKLIIKLDIQYDLMSSVIKFAMGLTILQVKKVVLLIVLIIIVQ